MMLRKDVLDALELSVPKTWPDLEQLVEKLSSSKPVDEEGNPLPVQVVLPTDGPFAAYSLLAISASSVRHRGKLDSVFERKTMTPMISQPPYVKALTALRGLTRQSKGQSIQQAANQFFLGQAAVAIGWPSVGWDCNADNVDETLNDTIVARLPGSKQCYDVSDEA